MPILANHPAVAAISLRKSYGSRVAVDGVSFNIYPGEAVGLLGPNGAGKSTTIAIVVGLVQADAGEVRICGELQRADHKTVGRRLGFVPQTLALYPSLTALQNLEFFARLNGMNRTEARSESLRVLNAVGLSERTVDLVSSLSGGMKRRLNLACGLVHHPDILLLDEPTTGVDLHSREQIMNIVRDLANTGTAVIYCTNYMEEVERTCDRILLINSGRVVAEGTVPELVAIGGGRPLMEVRLTHGLPPNWSDGLADVEVVRESTDEQLIVKLTHLAQANEVLEHARTAGARILDFTVRNPTLSDAFMTLTGRGLRDPESDSH